MSHVEYLCAFSRASGPRLLAAERLVGLLPHLLGPALVECDLLHRASAQELVLELCLLAEALTEPVRARLGFWVARAGGRAMALSSLGEEERQAFRHHVVACELRRTAVAPGALFEVAGPFFTEAGALASRRRAAIDRPMLVVEAGGPGWEGVAYDPSRAELFLPSPMAPPLGDEVMLVVRAAGVDRPKGVRARISGHRGPGEVGPGRPAGFSLGVPASAPSIRALLAQHAPASPSSTRGAPRYLIRAPVERAPGPAGEASAPAPPGAATAPDVERALEAASIENLSQGGAFVRSAAPLPVGSRLRLQFRLPNGAQLRTQAVVAFVNRDGMGVRFTPDAGGKATLQAAMAHLTARARRAAVVEGDGPFRHQLADALAERGFEVVTAPLTGDGLRLVSDELHGLDLLLTDVAMPGWSGEALVRTLRRAGGQGGAAIVIVSGKMSPAVERSLEAAGADAVLDRALGAELMAQAADAVLERRRLATAGG